MSAKYTSGRAKTVDPLYLWFLVSGARFANLFLAEHSFLTSNIRRLRHETVFFVQTWFNICSYVFLHAQVNGAALWFLFVCFSSSPEDTPVLFLFGNWKFIGYRSFFESSFNWGY